MSSVQVLDDAIQLDASACAAPVVHPAICVEPIFIIGAPRSGTTILAEALGKHSLLWSAQESEFLLDLYGHQHIEKAFQRTAMLEGDSWLRGQNVSKSEFFAYAGLGVAALFTSRSRGKRWIDHTNLYTHMAPTLAEMFPRGQFIHVLRDGREAVHSTLHFRNRFTPEEINCSGPSALSWVAAGRIAPWAGDFREACSVWSAYVEAALHFSEQYPSKCLTVRHEDLVQHADDVFAAIFSFLNVTYDDFPAEYVRSTRVNSSFPGHYQASTSPPHAANIWNEWSSEQRSVFNELAGPTMARAAIGGEHSTVERSQLWRETSPARQCNNILGSMP